MYKKLLVILTVAALTFTLASCGGNQDTDEDVIYAVPVPNDTSENGETSTESPDETDKIDNRSLEFAEQTNAENAEYRGTCGTNLEWYFRDGMVGS